MQYHIQTAPVWDAYRAEGCPLCRLFGMRESRLVDQYLSDNVMEPEFRVQSNRIGFCREHISMMYKGQNKLGLALQLETRASSLADLLRSPPADKKSAKKTAATLREHKGCVICDTLEELMPRYYITIAQMFYNEKEFPALFGGAKHCLDHAILLYDAAEYAGKSAPEYLAALTDGLKRDLTSCERDMRTFADCFDFKSGTRPDPAVIPEAIRLLMSLNVQK